jgi:hypothetical protein
MDLGLVENSEATNSLLRSLCNYLFLSFPLL